MSDLLALQQQQVSVAPGEAAEEPGEFTQYMRAAYWRHTDLKEMLAKEQAEHQETKRLYHVAQQEIAKLSKELVALRRGHGVIIRIAGRTFTLADNEQPLERPSGPEMQPITITRDWLNSRDGDHTGLEDSFILSKE